MMNKVKTLDVRNSRLHIMASPNPSKGGELSGYFKIICIFPSFGGVRGGLLIIR